MAFGLLDIKWNVIMGKLVLLVWEDMSSLSLREIKEL